MPMPMPTTVVNPMIANVGAEPTAIARATNASVAILIPSWGNMLAESRTFITRAPWLLFFPGMMIVATAFSLNLVGDALRDRLDPRFRQVFGEKG